MHYMKSTEQLLNSYNRFDTMKDCSFGNFSCAIYYIHHRSFLMPSVFHDNLNTCLPARLAIIGRSARVHEEDKIITRTESGKIGYTNTVENHFNIFQHFL